MSSLAWALAAALLSALSGAPALLLRRGSRAGQVLALVILGLGGLLGAGAALAALLSGAEEGFRMGWSLPWGEFRLGLDRLGAFFLLPIYLIPSLGALYGIGYRDVRQHPVDSRRLLPFYGLLAGGMALVVLARDGISFLLAWEAMALASWFAATADVEEAPVRRAGWIYLVATHVGSLALFALFALWRSATGSFDLAPAPGLGAETAAALFILALLGFGLKAGLVPLHVWLPGAHANAPSHVSALMSGVMIKLGLYGLLRMLSLLPPPPAWQGWTLLGLGALTALAGIAWALGQGDIKRVLAYSSVENVGIATLGFGLALLGRSIGRPSLVLLGAGGALFHVWNHSLFKPLLFLGAGRVIEATGTRRLEALGGLAAKLPLLGLLFGIGTAAISALPPLNGFMGEWLLYLGFFRGMEPGRAADLAAASAGAAVLAAVGALAAAAFVRLFGLVFLGQARSEAAETPHRVSVSANFFMALPMVLLALGCLALGLFPAAILPLLGDTAGDWAGLRSGGALLGRLADFSWTGPLALALLGLVGLPFLLFLRGARGARGPSAEIRGTWDCGYAKPSSRMQYGASSFAEFLGRNLVFVLPRRRKARLPSGAFPGAARFAQSAPDPVLDLGLRPLAALPSRVLARLRGLHQGQTQHYLVYILLATLLLLAVGAALP